MGLTDEQYRTVMRKGWNLTPEIYDRVWTPVLREYSIGCIDRAEVRPDDRVIDVATGPGTAALLAAERATRGTVLGVDISDRFVEVAIQAAAGRPNARFARHPMERLDLPDRSFDAATCVLGLMYGAPVSTALSEIARVLAPRGRFAACVWGQREKCCFRSFFPILGERLQMEVCPLFFALGVRARSRRRSSARASSIRKRSASRCSFDGAIPRRPAPRSSTVGRAPCPSRSFPTSEARGV